MAASLVHANGAAIPAIGLGTFRSEGEACIAAVSTALKAGYRHIDTARMYGNEVEVGQGLKAGGVPRDQVFVTTKVWWEDIAAGHLQTSAEASLKRLGLDQVDLLLIHWPNPAVPRKDSIAALCDARKKGLARHIGVSNFPVALLDEAVALASEPLVANQCEYHPRLDQTKLLAACRAHGVVLVSYCPIGQGALLSDATIVGIATRLGKTPAQVVMRWHMQQDGVAAIPKSSKRPHLVENISVFDFALSQADMKALSALASPNGRIVRPASAPDWD